MAGLTAEIAAVDLFIMQARFFYCIPAPEKLSQLYLAGGHISASIHVYFMIAIGLCVSVDVISFFHASWLAPRKYSMGGANFLRESVNGGWMVVRCTSSDSGGGVFDRWMVVCLWSYVDGLWPIIHPPPPSSNNIHILTKHYQLLILGKFKDFFHLSQFFLYGT